MTLERQTHLTPSLDAWVETAVTLSVLRSGPDTLAARRLKELNDRSLLPPVADEDLPSRLAEMLKIPASERGNVVAHARTSARQLLASRARHGLVPVTFRDAVYPEALGHIVDPPIVLWTRGTTEALSRPAVAIVGSRNATPAGLTIARQLGRELANAGFMIVSGMARGIDGAAHLGALDAGGVTVAVLGCGADVVYPSEHGALAARILASGAITSELLPGTSPQPRHFPVRNRIISGISRAVVVIEASDKSGSLITARTAIDQGREVLAVPGNVLSGRSRGSHQLIRDGARIVESAADVIEQLRWPVLPPRAVASNTKSLQLNGLEETMAAGEPYSVDDLAARTGRTAAELLADLGTLEISGRIVRTAGGQYVRLD